MRRLSATVLTLLLGVHPLLAQGPIARSTSKKRHRGSQVGRMPAESHPGGAQFDSSVRSHRW